MHGETGLWQSLMTANQTLGKIGGSLFLLRLLAENALLLWEDDPVEAKKYLEDVLAKLDELKNELS